MTPKPKLDAEASAMFLKRNWQIAYAVLLILLIPLTVILNTFFVVNRFKTTVDAEIQRTALVVGKMFNVTSLEELKDDEALRARVTQITAALPEVKSFDVLRKKDEEFEVIASLTPDAVGKTVDRTQLILSWHEDRAFAYLTKSPRSETATQTLTVEEARSGSRYWGVVMPIRDADGKKTLLLSMKFSLDTIDSLVRDNLFWSYVWLAITVLIVVLVLASNTRLFQYASLYKKLQEVDQMKDDFISMTSHELRAPITAVRGYLSLFLDDAFGKLEGKSKEVMQTTFAITTHLGTLVEDILEVSKIEQGRMSMDLVELDAPEVVEEVFTQLKFEAEKKKLAFTFKKPAQPLPKISVDRSRFRQVLINLFSNAIKYTPSGSVTVTAEVKDGGMVEVRVMDTGLGMSAEAREKLFQKFYRVRTNETSTIPGTGLGLWITKRIVELMKGRIYCDSIERVGTQMSVVFPAVGISDKKTS